MPDSEANEPSKADLERRVDQLEATVQKMMPTRRGVLTGLAGAGIGGAAVYGASENARAQAAGQVGTGTDPVDVEAWNLNVANQVTSDLAMGGNDVTGVGAMDVDDQTINRTITATGLDAPGLGSGKTAIEWLGSLRPSLVVSEGVVAGDNNAVEIIAHKTNSVIVIMGQTQSDGTVAFTDLLASAAVQSRTVVGSTERNVPGPRTYGSFGANLTAAIDDSGATYDITAIGLGGRP